MIRQCGMAFPNLGNQRTQRASTTMKMVQPNTLIVLIVIIVVAISSCSSTDKDKMIPIGPEVKASIVIYFKAGVTDQQIEDFWHNVISKPDPKGRGYYHRDGVGDISRIFQPVQGHEAISLTFFPDATQTERDEVRTAILKSPIVYKILENVAPADVKKID